MNYIHFLGALRWLVSLECRSTAQELLAAAAHAPVGNAAVERWLLTLAVHVANMAELKHVRARSGRELWRLDLGAVVHAAPITFAVGGRQYVTIATGNAFFTLGL